MSSPVVVGCSRGDGSRSLDLGVDQSCADVGVSEQLTYFVQARAVVEPVCREAVSQDMRGDAGDIARLRACANDEPEALSGDPLAAPVEEEPLGGRIRLNQFWPASVQVGAQGQEGLLADWQVADAEATSDATNLLLLEVQVAKVQCDQLRDPHAGGVQELEHGSVSQASGGVIAGAMKQSSHLIHRNDAWRCLDDLR